MNIYEVTLKMGTLNKGIYVFEDVLEGYPATLNGLSIDLGENNFYLNYNLNKYRYVGADSNGENILVGNASANEIMIYNNRDRTWQDSKYKYWYIANDVENVPQALIDFITANSTHYTAVDSVIEIKDTTGTTLRGKLPSVKVGSGQGIIAFKITFNYIDSSRQVSISAKLNGDSIGSPLTYIVPTEVGNLYGYSTQQNDINYEYPPYSLNTEETFDYSA